MRKGTDIAWRIEVLCISCAAMAGCATTPPTSSIAATAGLWLLKLVGALWLFGGVHVIYTVAQYQPLESALDEMEKVIAEHGLDGDEELGEAIADPGRNRWMAVGGALTFATGLGLVLSTAWVMAPLTLLLLHQVAYVWRQDRKVAEAKTEEGAEIASISRAAWRAARFTVVVWGAAALLLGSPL